MSEWTTLQIKKEEKQELEMLARRQGYLSVREMLLAKLGLKYEDGRRAIIGTASAKEKSAPYRIQTGSEWFLESEPSNVQMLIDGYMPLFEKQQGTPILIEVEQ